mgnify:FL=1|tara:strand:+ start:230 stop:484 length:255 start_codon:yes stop_codon:yes gene_type:complete
MSYEVTSPIFHEYYPSLFEGTKLDVNITIEVLKDGDLTGAMGEASLPNKGEKFQVTVKQLIQEYLPNIKGEDSPFKTTCYLSRD